MTSGTIWPDPIETELSRGLSLDHYRNYFNWITVITLILVFRHFFFGDTRGIVACNGGYDGNTEGYGVMLRYIGGYWGVPGG